MVSRFKFFLLIFFLSAAAVHAQQNPVNVNVNVVPPYSMYLSDYMQGSNKVVVTLVNQSMSETQRFKLQWRLTGNNDVSASTEQDAMPRQPIVLQPGQSITLSAQELRSRYQSFSRNDIEVEGMDLSSNLSNQTLPEGTYNLCAQALQYETNEPLSAGKPVGCSQPIRISIVDPPRIMKPRDQASITSPSPQFINFNWIPVNTRNARIEYKFKLVDITGADISPYDAMRSQNFKVYESRNLNQNFLNYGMGKPMLEDGHRYAVQVQAYDPTNQIRIKNDGKSEIHTFTYQQRQVAQSLLPDTLDLLPPSPSPTPTPSDDDTTELAQTGAKGKGNFQCGGHCTVDISNISKQATDRFGAGDTVLMGNFELVLTNTIASGNDNQYIGKANLVNATFIKGGSLPVLMTNVKINQNGRVFKGKAALEADRQTLKNKINELSGKPKLKDYIKNGVPLKKVYKEISGKSSKPKKAPVSLKKGFAHIKMVGLELTPTKATANLMAMLELKDDRIRNKYLTFATNDLCINPKGLAISEEEAYLRLMKPVTVDVSKNYTVTLLPADKRGKQDKQATYLNFDCDGFRDVQAYGMVKFSRDLVKPKNKNGKVSQQDTLAATFSTAFKNWDNWVAKLDFTSLPSGVNATKKLATQKFGYVKLPGYTFHVQKAYLDHSSKEDMFKKAGGGGSPVGLNAGAGWQGVYLSSADVWLPQFFNKKSSVQQGSGHGSTQNNSGNSERIRITGDQLVIGAAGVSGHIFATDLMDRGTLENMPLSIDTLDVDIHRNMLNTARMTGELTIPSFKKPLGYEANITYVSQQASYSFLLETKKTIRIPMWLATADLEPNSTVNLNIQGSQVDFKAVLNGKFTFDRTLGKVPGVAMNDLRFQNFKITNRDPYLDISNFGINTNAKAPKVVGYPTDLKNIDVQFGQQKYYANLGFDLRFNLSKGLSQISGESEVRLYSEINTNQNQGGKSIPEFTFKRAEIDSIKLNAQFGPMKILGSLNMYKNDPTFGMGFDGDLEMKVFDTQGFKGNALFGHKQQSNNQHLRYWYVDGMATFYPVGVPFAKPLAFYGFGGGAYFNLVQKSQVSSSKLKNKSLTQDPNVRERYKPQKNTIGMKASTIIGLEGEPFIINGDATLEAAFKRQPFGIKTLGFSGDAYALTGVRNRGNTPVKGSIDAEYQNNIFDFQSAFDIKVPPKSPVIQGNGDLRFHLNDNSNYWYLHFGTPKDRVGYSLGVGKVQIASSSGYFMAGDKILAPELPDKVSKYLGGYTSKLKQVNLGDKMSGVAAGLKFESGFDLGGKVARAEGDVIAGADVVLGKYAPSMLCNGNSDFGLDHWYALGQGYFYGNLGFYVAQKEILGTTAGSVVEVGLPDPVGVKGQIKADLVVLGKSLVFNQNFSIGSICDFQSKGGGAVSVSSPVERMQFISSVTPNHHQKGVGLFVEPTITFNRGIYHDSKMSFTYSDGKGGSQKATYRFDISYTWEKEYQPGRWTDIYRNLDDQIMEDYDKNSETLTLTLKENVGSLASKDYRKIMLEGNTRYRLKATVTVEEKTGANTWETATYNVDSLKGQKIQHVETHIFTTGGTPKSIPEQQVVDVIPTPRRRYFTQDDYDEGFMRFNTDISAVWDSLETEGYDLKARFEPINSSGDQNEILQSVRKTNDGRLVKYDIPTLKQQTIYRLELIATPPEEESSQSGGLTGKDKSPGKSIWGDDDSDKPVTKMAGKAQEGARSMGRRLNTEVLYTSYFRTSQFNTMKAKINALSVSQSKVVSKQANRAKQPHLEKFNAYDVVQITLSGSEPFGYYDLQPANSRNASHVDVETPTGKSQWQLKMERLIDGDDFCVSAPGRLTPAMRLPAYDIDSWAFAKKSPSAVWSGSGGSSYKHVDSPLSDSEVGIDQSSGNSNDNTYFLMPINYGAGGGQSTNQKVLTVSYRDDYRGRLNHEKLRECLNFQSNHPGLSPYPAIQQGTTINLEVQGAVGTKIRGSGANTFSITLNP